ncbi:hypothetical protein M0R45_029481 [Rubus argutus]|uniref:Secreted protein n=1 Tax=Rubus argutus TaxID=59490 RepID=A0AAW1W7T3_RUBAR
MLPSVGFLFATPSCCARTTAVPLFVDPNPRPRQRAHHNPARISQPALATRLHYESLTLSAITERPCCCSIRRCRSPFKPCRRYCPCLLPVLSARPRSQPAPSPEAAVLPPRRAQHLCSH